MKPDTTEVAVSDTTVQLSGKEVLHWLADNCQLTIDTEKNRVTVSLSSELWLKVAGPLVAFGQPIQLNPILDKNGQPEILIPKVIAPKKLTRRQRWLLKIGNLFARLAGCTKCLKPI